MREIQDDGAVRKQTEGAGERLSNERLQGRVQVTEEMVEAAKRGFWERGPMPFAGLDEYDIRLKAAIEAAEPLRPALAEQAGGEVVLPPSEPTPEMIRAGEDAMAEVWKNEKWKRPAHPAHVFVLPICRAMLAASPQPSPAATQSAVVSEDEDLAERVMSRCKRYAVKQSHMDPHENGPWLKREEVLAALQSPPAAEQGERS